MTHWPYGFSEAAKFLMSLFRSSFLFTVSTAIISPGASRPFSMTDFSGISPIPTSDPIRKRPSFVIL